MSAPDPSTEALAKDLRYLSKVGDWFVTAGMPDAARDVYAACAALAARLNQAEEAPRIKLWFCDECGYWRSQKTTGVHQAANPFDLNGRMVVHHLREVEATLAASSAGERE